MTKAAISLIQTGLRDLGYAPGPVDGLFGAQTNAAVRSWLSANGTAAQTGLRPATAAMLYQGAARYPVEEVVVHCSATRPNWMAGSELADQFAEIRRWHIQDRGWRDIGYHWVIGRDGKVMAGRPETEIGAHVEGRNRGTIGICLIGGHGSTERDRFSQNFTPAQDLTLRQMLQAIGMRTQIRRISGHNEYAAKACPGFQVAAWLKEAA